MKIILQSKLFFPILICLLFFIAYSTLSLVKHAHFLSSYDLVIADQIVWKYSRLKVPTTTIQAFAYTSIFEDHIEVIYVLLAPFYWIWNSANMLLLLQAFAICSSGPAIYFLARNKGLNVFTSSILLISYLAFYGIQFALWSDVHSLVFAVGFLAWFVYAFETGHTKDFKQNSPCGKVNCIWFRWFGHPQYMVVDTSNDWDARYWLTNRENFVEGLNNLQKAGVIKKIYSVKTSAMYKILRDP